MFQEEFPQCVCFRWIGKKDQGFLAVIRKPNVFHFVSTLFDQWAVHK